MSLMTRDLCTKYKDLARRKNEAEPEGSNFEYRTKYQFSIIKHTKGDPDDIHGIAHSLNPSEPYSELKLRKGMDLVPYPNEEVGMEVPDEAREVQGATDVGDGNDVQDGQDLGNVETVFNPPGSRPSDGVRETLATPIGRKRDRDVVEEEEAQVDAALRDPKKRRDNNRDIIPRGRPPFRPFPGHGGQPRGGYVQGQGQGGHRGAPRTVDQTLAKFFSIF